MPHREWEAKARRLTNELLKLAAELEEKRKVVERKQQELAGHMRYKWRDDDSPKGEFKTASSPEYEEIAPGWYHVKAGSYYDYR